MGNKTGWIIAAVAVAIISVIVIKFTVFPDPSEPTRTTRQAGALDKIAIETPIQEIIGYAPADAGNAGEHYAAAVKHIQDNPGSWDEVFKVVTQPDGQLSWQQVAYLNKVLALIEPAATMQSMNYTFTYTPKTFVPLAKPAAYTDLDMLKDHLLAAWRYYTRSEEHEKALQVAKSLAVLGWHMTNERVRAWNTMFGFQWQASAAKYLEATYRKLDNADAAGKCRTYATRASSAASKTQRKYDDLLRQRNPPAGDIFNLIENDDDRAWRVDGVLTLGLLKFTRKGHRGDMRYLDKYIAEYAASDDPYLKAAAQAARDVTHAELERQVN